MADSAGLPAGAVASLEPVAAPQAKRLNFFARYLTLWVALCMVVVGVGLGKLLPELVGMLRGLELGRGSQINVPIAVLIWLMIYPMMLKIDFGSVLDVRKRPRGVLVTLVNWLVKPFSMALLGWVFFQHRFLPIIGPELADQYVAGTIILAAAPCTAMVFVWSYLTDGDAAYTLVIPLALGSASRMLLCSVCNRTRRWFPALQA
jgi:ACR3 family arsenite transporter